MEPPMLASRSRYTKTALLSREAMKDYREDPVTYSLDEVEQELGLR